MSNAFKIQQEEKLRILNLHESATKRQYLSEQWSANQLFRKADQDKYYIVDASGKVIRMMDYNSEADRNLPMWLSQPPSTGTKQPVKTGGEKMTNPVPPKSGGNSDIKKIQEKLIQLGYSVGDTRADGIMGKNTIKGILMALDNTEAINTPMTPKTINQIPTNTPEPQLQTPTTNSGSNVDTLS